MSNRVILRGYVADDPFVRATEGGKFVRIRMATIEHIVVQKTGKMRRHTEWHTISLWGESAELADREIKIGSALHIEGALRTREWEDKNGVVRYTTEISASKMEILNSIEGCEIPDFIATTITTANPKTSAPELSVKRPAADPDDLPF